MKDKLQKAMQAFNLKKQEKSFVIAMMIMGIFNFALVLFMIDK